MKCLYYRWKISQALDGDGETSLPARHLEKCPVCRAFHRDSLALAAALREDAHTVADRPIARLRPARRLAIRVAAAAALAAGVALAIALGWLHMQAGNTVAISPPPASKPLPSPVAAPTPQPPPLAVATLALDTTKLQGLIALAGKPLTDELENTRQDALSSGKALASYLTAPPTGR
jgi:hypothetical protein